MNLSILDQAEEDLEEIFAHYQAKGEGLGIEFLDQYRRGLEQILRFPEGWQSLGGSYRVYRLNRFPHYIVYELDHAAEAIVITAIKHGSQSTKWQGRE